MKKTITLLAFGALTALTGCRTKTCDAGYEHNFYIINKTIHDIIIINTRGAGEVITSIDPGKRERICNEWYLGSCDNTTILQDYFEPTDILPLGHILPKDEAWLEMLIDGKPVPVEIWRRKYWFFDSTYYEWTYILTVTDDLLNEITTATETTE